MIFSIFQKNQVFGYFWSILQSYRCFYPHRSRDALSPVWRIFVTLFALSTHCKYDFIHFTFPQWMSTWMFRICHIALTAVLSKTEHRILYILERGVCTLLTIHWSLYTAHCTLLTVHCLLYTAHCILLTVHCWVSTAHCTLLTVHCSLYIANCTQLPVHWSLYRAHCTLLTAQCLLYTAHCTLLTVHCSLYTVHCTLPIVHCSL